MGQPAVISPPPPGFIPIEQAQGAIPPPPPGFVPIGTLSPELQASLARNANPTQFEKDRDPANQPGFFSSLGSELGGMAKGLVTKDAAERVLGASAASALNMGTKLVTEDIGRKSAGRSLPYRALAAAGNLVGANARGMEDAADVGNKSGVMGVAAGDATPSLIPVAKEAIPLRVSEIIKMAPSKAFELARAGSERMYQSALKPSLASYSIDEIKSMVRTGLDGAIPVTEKGASKLAGLISDLNQKVSDTIASNPDAPIDKYKVASRLADTTKQFDTQVNPEKDLAAVSNSGNEFLRNQPAEIPASDAQALKVGTYQQLRAKYGELKNAQMESQKALARGLKEELENAFPDIKDLNAKESKFIGLDEALDRAVKRIQNKDLIGFSTPVMGAAGAVLGGAATGNLTGAAAFGIAGSVLKEVIGSPGVKSRLAIAINKAARGKVSVGASQRAVNAYHAALAAQVASGNREYPAKSE